MYQWTPEMGIGNPVVDEEHKGIFDMANALHDGVADIIDARRKLLAYARNHFIHEEEMLLEAGYPDLDLHIKMHDDFKLRVQAVDHMNANDLREFVLSWLVNHIMQADQQYVPYIRTAHVA